jgi:hypothetical protein
LSITKEMANFWAGVIITFAVLYLWRPEFILQHDESGAVVSDKIDTLRMIVAMLLGGIIATML